MEYKTSKHYRKGINKPAPGKATYIAILIAVFVYLSIMSAELRGDSNVLWAAVPPGLFISLLTPGFMLMRLLRFRARRDGEGIVFSAGLSIFLLMAAGLTLNTLLPLAGIGDPLAPKYVVGLVAGMNAALLLACYMRGVDLNVPVRLRQVNFMTATLYAAPVLFVAGGILGAISLNNGGSNVLTMFVLGGVAVFSLVVLFSGGNKVPASLLPFSIYLISLALLLSMSLRGWLISGHDILQEFSVFQLTHAHLHWSIGYFRDAYNACLSITILPTVISGLAPKIPDQYIFRFVFQAVFALMPVAMYGFIRRYVNRRYAFITVLFFISQVPLLRDSAFLTRQEMALFFFTLLLTAMINTAAPRGARFFMALVFGMSMIWSHYSTTYLGLGVFLTALLIKSRPVRSVRRRFTAINWPSAIWRMLRKSSIRKIPERVEASEAETPDKSGWLPGWLFTLLLICLTLAWNTLITNTSNNLSTVAGSLWKTVSSTNGFWDLQKGVGQQFSVLGKSQDQSQLITEYASSFAGGDNTDRDGLPYLPDKYQGYNPQFDTPVLLNAKVPAIVGQSVYYFGEVAKKLAKVFMVVGIIWLIATRLGWSLADDDLKVLIEANIGVLILFVVMPMVSGDYGLLRAYEQLLVVLALPTVIGGAILLKAIFKRYAYHATAVFFVIYFLYIGSFIPQLIGVGYAQMQLNNFGTYYDIYYTHQSEDYSIKWLGTHANSQLPVYADWFAKKKIAAFGPRPIWVIANVLPANITQDSYVFADETNVNKGAAFVFYQQHELNYQFPTAFLNQQKDLIYDNGKSEIFR